MTGVEWWRGQPRNKRAERTGLVGCDIAKLGPLATTASLIV